MFSLARPFSQFSRCVRVPHTLTPRRLGRWCSGNAGKAVEAPTSRRRWRVRDVVKTGLVAGTLYFLYKQNVGSPYLFERGVTPEFLDSVLARQGVVESLDEVIEGGTRQRIVMVEMQKSVIPGTDPPISTAGCDVTVMPAMPWYMFSPFLFSRDVRQTWRAIKDHDPEKEVVVIFADTGVFGKHLKAYKRPWPPASGVTEVNYQRRPPPTACHLSTVTDTILGDKEMVTSFAKAVRQKRAEAGGVSDVYVSATFLPRLTRKREGLEMENGDVVPIFHVGWGASRALPRFNLFHATRGIDNDDDLREAIGRALAKADHERQIVVAVVDQGFAFFQGPLSLVAIVDAPPELLEQGSLPMDTVGAAHDLAAMNSGS